MAKKKVSETNLLCNTTYKIIPKNIIFPKGFLLNHMKKVVFVISNRGDLKNFKTRSSSDSGLGLSTHIKKKEIKILLDYLFKHYFSVIPIQKDSIIEYFLLSSYLNWCGTLNTAVSDV